MFFKRWTKRLIPILVMNIKLILEPNDHGKHIYHPGHVLKGTAILTLLRTKKFRGIYIKVYGRARTYWARQTQVYESIEVYIDTNIYLVGPKNNPTFELQPGTHKYNFSHKLSEKLPSSINLKYGNIAYFIEAVPDIPWMFGQQFKIPFVVARCDDLNLYRNLKEPVKIVEKKNFFPHASQYSIQNDSNPLHLTVMMSHSGFVANQIVSMTVLYKNESDVNVVKTTVTFNQKVEFRSSTIPQLKIDEYKLVEVHAEGVDAKKSKSFPISFKIPNVASSNRRFCKVITVSYFIEVLGDLGREHSNLKVKIPITIGDIPIRSQEESLAVEPSAPPEEPLSGLVADLLLVLPSSPPLEILMDDFPPSYEDAIKMIQN